MALVIMVDLFMALLSFVESAPRAYRLKASNAAPASSTSTGTIPGGKRVRVYLGIRLRTAADDAGDAAHDAQGERLL